MRCLKIESEEGVWGLLGQVLEVVRVLVGFGKNVEMDGCRGHGVRKRRLRVDEANAERGGAGRVSEFRHVQAGWLPDK